MRKHPKLFVAALLCAATAAIAADNYPSRPIRLVVPSGAGGITESDVAGAQPVAVVNEVFASRFWPGQDPIGKRFRQGREWRTVVGVAKQGKYHSITEPGMALTYLAPVAFTLFGHGIAQVLGLVTWVLMAIAFQPTLRFYRLSPLWGLALPAIALVYLAFTLDSAYQHALGRGGMWKGRAQANLSGSN